jgi:hypothetical protein
LVFLFNDALPKVVNVGNSVWVLVHQQAFLLTNYTEVLAKLTKYSEVPWTSKP